MTITELNLTGVRLGDQDDKFKVICVIKEEPIVF